MAYRLVVIAGALALAACAPTEGAAPGGAQAASAGSPRTCFLPQQVVNYRSVRDRTVYVRTIRDDVFEIDAAGCFDLGTSFGLAIIPSFGVNDRLCVGDGARITVSNPSAGQGPCMARVVRSLTPEEVAALPGRDRP